MGLSHSSRGDSGCLYSKIEFAEVSQTLFRVIAVKLAEITEEFLSLGYNSQDGAFRTLTAYVVQTGVYTQSSIHCIHL